MSAPLPVDDSTRLNEELTALLEVTDSALSTLDLDTLLAVLLERLVRVMRADAGAILLVDGQELAVRAIAGFGEVKSSLPRIPAGQGFGGRILATGQPLHIEDARKDPRILGTFLGDHGISSMLGVPLRTKDRLVGVLHVDWRDPHRENATDLRLLETAAERCATAIVNAQLFEELRSAKASGERVRDRLALALVAADLGVWDWDVPSGRVVWDETNERIFGLAPGTYDGSYETFERLIHPEDVALLRASIGAALEGAPYAPSFRIVRPDGQVRWLAVHGRFQRAPDGRPLRLLGVTADVTEERLRVQERELLLARERDARRELKATNEKLRALSARLQTVREEEAVRIAREIHDELGQLLTALRMDVSWVRARVSKLEGGSTADTALILARIDGMAELTDRTVRTVQRISEGLRPAALDQLGLEAAIEAQLTDLGERSGIATRLTGTLGELRLGDAIETGVFRIVQELLTNVARHAGASTVEVSLRLEDDRLTVSVADDGRGILAAEVGAPRSLGLMGLRERAFLLGGTAEIHGEANRGTMAVVSVPCGPRP